MMVSCGDTEGILLGEWIVKKAALRKNNENEWTIVYSMPHKVYNGVC